MRNKFEIIRKLTTLPLRALRTSAANSSFVLLRALLWPTIFALAVCGCTGSRPLRGGHAVTTGAVTQALTQSENPSAASRQSQETLKVRTYTEHLGTTIESGLARLDERTKKSPPSSSSIPFHAPVLHSFSGGGSHFSVSGACPP